MFNQSWPSAGFLPPKATGGSTLGDYYSHRTLYAGVDPADRNRILVRKIVQISPSTYAYEEIRVTPGDSIPNTTYHSTLYRLKGFDLRENLTQEEINIRGTFRPVPNVVGFSLFSKHTKLGNHASIVENTIYKNTGSTWLEWFQDFRDRRDMANFLRLQWYRNY